MSGHIRRRGDKTWELKFDLGTDPLTGKRLTRYHNVKGTKREAQIALTKLLGQRDDGIYVEPTKMTLAEYLNHWLKVDIDRRVAARTAQRHHGIVEKNIIPRIGHVLVRKLTPSVIEAFEAALQREGWVKARAKPKIKKGEEPPGLEPRGLSAQTVQHVHRTLSQALGHAVRLGVLFRNPCQQVKPSRPPSREIKILSKDEIVGLLDAASDGELHLPVLLAATTGMRRGELLGLRWSDVDLKAGSLTVNQALERIKGIVSFKAPKTKTSRRTITLPTVTVEALQKHFKAQAEDRLKLGLGRDPRGLVLTRADGQPLDADSLSKAWPARGGDEGHANHVPRPAAYPYFTPTDGRCAC
jgi:integrase